MLENASEEELERLLDKIESSRFTTDSGSTEQGLKGRIEQGTLEDNSSKMNRKTEQNRSYIQDNRSKNSLKNVSKSGDEVKEPNNSDEDLNKLYEDVSKKLSQIESRKEKDLERDSKSLSNQKIEKAMKIANKYFKEKGYSEKVIEGNQGLIRKAVVRFLKNNG